MSEVLVFKTELLADIGGFQGFTLDVDKYLHIILTSQNNCFIERHIAEQDETYKQIIPYVVLRYRDSVFCYVRGSLSKERRLVGAVSIALGGHIEKEDKYNSLSIRDIYSIAARRELNEEVRIESSYKEAIVALINDDTTDVGRLHFGILHIWDLSLPIVKSIEKTIEHPQFVRISDLKEQYYKMEEWSKIAFQILCSNKIPTYNSAQ